MGLRTGFVSAAVLGLSIGMVGCSGGSANYGAPMHAIAPLVAPPAASTAYYTGVAPRATGAAPRAVAVAPAYASTTARPTAVTPVNPYPAPRAYLAPYSSPAPARDLRVMTFNLRVATAFDGLNTWEFRKGMVLERIRTADPDLLGTQEGLEGQEKFLQKQLTDYTFFGAGRSDGKRGGEMCGVFFKTARFEKIAGGHFWLSEKPAKAGSKGWGAWFPRMVTWVKLKPRDARDGGGEFVWFNTHFDAFASRARNESARLLLERMSTISGSAPCIVTGDFNAGQDSQPYRMLCSKLAGVGPMLVDAFRAANPKQVREEGTRHGFSGSTDGERIDWILASPAFQAVSSSIDRSRGLLGYPSDHFPVVATFRPAAAAGAGAGAATIARVE